MQKIHFYQSSPYEGRLVFGVPKASLIMLAFLWGCVACLSYLLSQGESIWAAFGVGFFAFQFGHIYITGEKYIVLPGLMCIVASLNWIVAPWVFYNIQTTTQLFNMVVPPETFFPLAVPSAITLWLGSHAFQLVVNTERLSSDKISLTIKERRLLDGLIIFGFVALLAGRYVPASLKFFVYLLAQLRFVGALAFVVSDTKGWLLRVSFVFLHLFVYVSAVGVFYEFVLWGGFLLILLAYLGKWKSKLVLDIFVALTLGGILNIVKADYREKIEFNPVGSYEKVILLSDLIIDKVLAPAETFSLENIEIMLIRYNQGWIMSRAFARVPAQVPYAEGETIGQAIVNLIPRFLLPSKERIASKDFLYQYAGIELNENTSMTLGVAGEMYVNFGPFGGPMAVYLYGLVLSYTLSRFFRVASLNRLWWAIIPFIFLACIQVDWNISDILNYTIKSMFVLYFTLYFIKKLGYSTFAQDRFTRVHSFTPKYCSKLLSR